MESPTEVMSFQGIGSVARELGLHPYKLRYDLNVGNLPDNFPRGPNGCRLFRPSDVERLRAAIRKRWGS